MGRQSDVYAFGCVLFEMLSWAAYHARSQAAESEALETIVKACLENDPEDRWQSVRDLKRALLAANARAFERCTGRRKASVDCGSRGAGSRRSGRVVLAPFRSGRTHPSHPFPNHHS